MKADGRPRRLTTVGEGTSARQTAARAAHTKLPWRQCERTMGGGNRLHRWRATTRPAWARRAQRAGNAWSCRLWRLISATTIISNAKGSLKNGHQPVTNNSWPVSRAVACCVADTSQNKLGKNRAREFMRREDRKGGACSLLKPLTSRPAYLQPCKTSSAP